MTPRQLARIHRALRVRAGRRQSDVAAAASVSRTKVIKLEAGDIGDLLVREAEACFAALGASLHLTASWRGAGLDRLLDAVHAMLIDSVVRLLRGSGWDFAVEVSFSENGERGSIDILAWHPIEQALLVIEVKSELPGLDRLLRPLDVKVRLAPRIALERYGWAARTVSRLVVFPEDRTVRRIVERHANVFDRALPARSREIRQWLRQPTSPVAGLWFLTYVAASDFKRNPSAIRRVRVGRRRRRSAQPRSAEAQRGVDRTVTSGSSTGIELIDPHKVYRRDM